MIDFRRLWQQHTAVSKASPNIPKPSIEKAWPTGMYAMIGQPASVPPHPAMTPADLSAALDALPTSPVIELSVPASSIQAPEETLMANKFFAGIENIEHSSVQWLETELQNFEKSAPTIERIVDTSVAYAGGALQIALQAAGQTAAASVVGTIITKAHADLQVASALVTDFGATPTAASMFTAVQGNLQNLLSAAQVTNKTSIASVTKAVSEIGVVAAAVNNAASAISASAQPVPEAPVPSQPLPVAGQPAPAPTPAT